MTSNETAYSDTTEGSTTQKQSKTGVETKNGTRRHVDKAL